MLVTFILPNELEVVDWTVVTPVISLIQTALLLAAAAVTIAQVRESSRIRRVQSLMRVFQEFHSEGKTEDRERLLMMSNRSLKRPTGQGLGRVQRVVEFHEWVGLLTRQRLLPERVLLDIYSNLFSESWRLTRPYVLIRRAKPGYANYAEHFEFLAMRSMKYREKKYGTPEDEN